MSQSSKLSEEDQKAYRTFQFAKDSSEKPLPQENLKGKYEKAAN